MQKNEIVVSPVSLYILMSSPNVKYETKIVTIKSAPAKNGHHEEGRLSDRFLGGRQCNGE